MIGEYIIDREGVVYNKYHQPKTEHFDRDGYSFYKLSVGGVKGNYKTHILQAKEHPEICGEWFEGAVVHHIDHDKKNNRPENLKVMTREEHLALHSESDITSNRRIESQAVNAVHVKCIDTGIIFKSVNEAAKWVKGSASNIVKCCRNKYGHNTAYGYKWEYYGMDKYFEGA